METLVIDCSVAAKWLLLEPGREGALAVFDRYQAGEIALIAPDLLLVEFASLVSRHVRRKAIQPHKAQELFDVMSRVAPPLTASRPLLGPALRISFDQQISLWDAVYIALAIEQDCPFLTADARLARGSSRRHPRIRLLNDPPSLLT